MCVQKYHASPFHPPLKLLLKIIRKGWSYIECDKALSCGIPNNADGDRWKAKAMRLAGQSDGLLPPYLPERLTAATAAGSHTTGVLRLLDWAGTHQIPCPDEMFKSICPNGYLSQSQVLHRLDRLAQGILCRLGEHDSGGPRGTQMGAPEFVRTPIRHELREEKEELEGRQRETRGRECREAAER